MTTETDFHALLARLPADLRDVVAREFLQAGGTGVVLYENAAGSDPAIVICGPGRKLERGEDAAAHDPRPGASPPYVPVACYATPALADPEEAAAPAPAVAG
jgi:hypothetical protein